ncbi:MAG TPA: beta-eliminating lyase-related protein, partial [Pyrinomonadaceae bacterium]
ASLFDSLYVSMYKGLSAISGGALVGPRNLVDEARQWQLRFGGTPRILAPYVIDSLRALEQKLPLMPQYYHKALSLAAALKKIPDLWITPDPPQTNTFLIAIRGNHLRLRDCALEVASETGLWLVDFVRPAGIDGLAQFQVVAGDATLELEVEDVVRASKLLIEKLK